MSVNADQVIGRSTLVGAVLGVIAGLLLGYRAHPPTMWFAAIEIGIPGALAGALLGTAGWWVYRGVRAVRSR